MGDFGLEQGSTLDGAEGEGDEEEDEEEEVEEEEDGIMAVGGHGLR